jgi:hypothetical protein
MSKGELRQKLEDHGFPAAGHVAGAMPMAPHLRDAWKFYEESNGDGFHGYQETGGSKPPVVKPFIAPKVLTTKREYKA